MLVSASPKAVIVSQSVEGLAAAGGWQVVDNCVFLTIWSGSLSHLGALRLLTVHGLNSSEQTQGSKSPFWHSDESQFTHLQAASGTFSPRLDLGLAPSQLNLDQFQDLAATPDDRLTAVIGAAGSGKSRVLVERLVRTVIDASRRAQQRVLVTTFNKLVIEQLADWFADVSVAQDKQCVSVGRRRV